MRVEQNANASEWKLRLIARLFDLGHSLYENRYVALGYGVACWPEFRGGMAAKTNTAKWAASRPVPIPLVGLMWGHRPIEAPD